MDITHNPNAHNASTNSNTPRPTQSSALPIAAHQQQIPESRANPRTSNINSGTPVYSNINTYDSLPLPEPSLLGRNTPLVRILANTPNNPTQPYVLHNTNVPPPVTSLSFPDHFTFQQARDHYQRAIHIEIYNQLNLLPFIVALEPNYQESTFRIIMEEAYLRWRKHVAQLKVEVAIQNDDNLSYEQAVEIERSVLSPPPTANANMLSGNARVQFQQGLSRLIAEITKVAREDLVKKQTKEKLAELGKEKVIIICGRTVLKVLQEWTAHWQRQRARLELEYFQRRSGQQQQGVQQVTTSQA